MAAIAIRNWAADQGLSCEVEKVALEGEGMIQERVDTLWKLLLNWIDKIRQADFVFVAAHSQGTPVAIMLVAKLIEFGYIRSSSKCDCATLPSPTSDLTSTHRHLRNGWCEPGPLRLLPVSLFRRLCFGTVRIRPPRLHSLHRIPISALPHPPPRRPHHLCRQH